MSCEKPLVAIRLGNSFPGHKDKIKILSKYRLDETFDLVNRYGADNVLFLPCGHCASCKLKYRKDWAIRCEMESLYYTDNCFVTLTYDDEHLLPHPKREELRYFIKKLRDIYGIKCRYFGCGEVGLKTGRSHYHVILFGYKPHDLKFYGLSKSGMDMYSSKFLEHVWSKGKVFINDFNVRCASYVAGYVSKKFDKDNFLMFSTHPGLGFNYISDNLNHLFKYGCYTGKNGQVSSLPRYFEKVAEKLNYYYDDIKISRKESMRDIVDSEKFSRGVTHDSELFPIKGQIMKDKLKRLKRSL